MLTAGFDDSSLVSIHGTTMELTLEAVDEVYRRQLDDLQRRHHHDACAADHSKRLRDVG